jgi:hypothetical protein
MPTQTFDIATGADDGYTWCQDTFYPPTTRTGYYSPTEVFYAQRSFSTPNYLIASALMRWDTSTLPAGAATTSATLRLRFSQVYDPAESRSLTIDWYLLQNTAADYSQSALTDAYAGRLISTIGIGVDVDFPLLDATSHINTAGYTGLRLHIDGAQPAGFNAAEIVAKDHTTLSASAPRLLVTYTTGPQQTLRPDGIITQTNDTKSLADLQRDVV